MESATSEGSVLFAGVFPWGMCTIGLYVHEFVGDFDSWGPIPAFVVPFCVDVLQLGVRHGLRI